MGPQPQPAITPDTLDVKNPATGEQIASIQPYSISEAEAALDLVRAFQPSWAGWPLAERAAVVRTFARPHFPKKQDGFTVSSCTE